MDKDKHELKVTRYVHHQVRQKPDKKFDVPYITQDTIDYFPYESIYIKTSEEVKQYLQDTLVDFTKIYPNAACSEKACIYYLITEFSLKVIISDIIDDEELPNVDHVYNYVVKYDLC